MESQLTFSKVTLTFESCYLLNCALKVEFPSTWHMSTIVPVFKKVERADPKCYRPISLIESSVKLLGKALLAKLEY